jgi:sortase A
MKKFLLFGILLLGLAEFGYGAWIPAKAWLSQFLLTNSWQETLSSGQSTKPWPWADTWPIFKLTHQPSNTSLIVLQGDSGQALAFGPGWTSASALPGDTGNTIISAHRDTHFNFLRQAKTNDIFILQDSSGKKHHYQLVSSDIVDSANAQLLINTTDDRLTLVTCYPFDQLMANGDARYVVTAIKAG